MPALQYSCKLGLEDSQCVGKYISLNYVLNLVPASVSDALHALKILRSLCPSILNRLLLPFLPADAAPLEIGTCKHAVLATLSVPQRYKMMSLVIC
jgi:hypothetical protein